jgi:hypothetical protein
MGAIAAMWMLVARSGQRVERLAEVELEPFEPGAWAAWAKAQPAVRGRDEIAAGAGRETRLPFLPRGIALRLRP